MRTCAAFVVSALCVAMAVTPVYAQQPAAPADPHHPPAPAGSPPVTPPAATPGMHGGGMPMMDMCRQMMAGMMAASADPKERAAMLEMHGEMMKAMGDVMMKHGRRMHGMPGKGR